MVYISKGDFLFFCEKNFLFGTLFSVILLLISVGTSFYCIGFLFLISIGMKNLILVFTLVIVGIAHISLALQIIPFLIKIENKFDYISKSSYCKNFYV